MVISANPSKSGGPRKRGNSLTNQKLMASYCRPVRSKIGKESLFRAFYFPLKLIDTNLLVYAGAQPAGAQQKGGRDLNPLG